MAWPTTYDKAPSNWITGYTLSTALGSITNMNTAFPEMSLAEADHTTGSFPNMLFAMLHKWYVLYTALTTKSANMVISRYDSTSTLTGKVTTTFTVQFITALAVGSQTVDEEA